MYRLYRQILHYLISYRKFLIFIFFLLLLFKEVFREEIILEPLNVPDELVSIGYSGEVIADMLLDEVHTIEFNVQNFSKNIHIRDTNTNTFFSLSNYSQDAHYPNIKLLGTSFSFRSIILYIRQALDLKYNHLSGDIVQIDDGLIITIRNSSSANIPYIRELVELDNLEDWIRNQGSESLIKITRPSILAMHLFDQYISLKLINPDENLESEKLLKKINEIKNYGLKYRPSTDKALFYTVYGTALIYEENKKGAVLQFKSALLINPQYADAYIGLIKVLGELNRINEAKEIFHKALKANIDHLEDIYAIMAIVYANKKRYEESISMFKKSTTYNPNSSNSYINWGIVLNQLELYDEAIEKFQYAAKIDPNNPLIYLNWGLSLTSLNRHLEAMDKFETTYVIDRYYMNTAGRLWSEASKKLRQCSDPSLIYCSEVIHLDSYRKHTD